MGKGDRNRSCNEAFRNNFDEIFGERVSQTAGEPSTRDEKMHRGLNGMSRSYHEMVKRRRESTILLAQEAGHGPRGGGCFVSGRRC